MQTLNYKMVEESNIGCVVNVDKWLKENEESFKPPVCNSIMAGGYLKIMFVGGPNVRKDYHMDQGEELFYMLKGDMCLKIMEKGEPKDIHIREGEVFVLPSRIPHSPQRNANTLGLVIERERADQWDGLRYYCEDGKTILFQKYFHLRSLVQDFLPVIKEYFASEQYKTGVPIPGTTDEDEEKFKVDRTSTVNTPFLLSEWVKENRKELDNQGKVLFEQGEFKVYANGEGNFSQQNPFESWIWLMNGKCKLQIDGQTAKQMTSGDSIIVPQNQRFSLLIEGSESVCMIFTMDRNATPQK
uniref:3-hydroxyanthranilate 3,4-dioxygenase n=1 Tax=Clytia hemisphaerica TaxID=252671 RepID=A0A7M5VEF4_9CNID